MLGITTDNHLKFYKHISLLCAKANRKFSAFDKISYYLKKAFFEPSLDIVII